MKAGSKLLNAVSAVALSAGVSSVVGLGVLGSAGVANAAVISNIDVRGADRAGAEAVRSNITIAPGQNFSPADIDESVKRLYATGYFSNVSMRVSGRSLVVTVSENSLINQVVFNGNRKIKDDKLAAVAQTKSLGAFDQATIDADIARIKEAYGAIGRSDVQVTTQVASVGQGRVNIAFVINEGERTKISTIDFVGNSAFSASRLSAVIQTKTSGIFSFLTRKDVYNQDKLAADEEALREFYYDRGYADFRVLSSEAVLNEATNEYTITFNVDEGQRYQVGDVTVESTVPGIDGNELKGLVETASGSTYNASKVQKSIEAISQRVASEGYPFARVTPRGNRDLAGNTLGVTYIVEQGERAYVERIEIRGNTRTRDYVIRREFDISEGDAFNQTVVTTAKRRLEALGYFSKVNIGTSQGSAADRVVIIVDVEDQSTGSFGIGAGYSQNDGVLLEASVEEKNFLGRGQFIRLAAGAGENDARNYNFSFTEPYFLGYRLAAGFDLFQSQTSSADTYRYDEIGGTLRVTAPITENLATTFRYTYKELKYEGKNGSTLAFPYKQIVEGGKWQQSILSNTINYSDVDDGNMPRNGWQASLTNEFAGLGGDSEYYKIFGKVRYTHSISDEFDIIGSLTGQAGHVVPTGDNLLVFDQFKFGGRQVRGFKNDGIGPRMGGESIGGTTYFAASAEVTAPMPLIPEDFGLRIAGFADAGTLYGTKVKTGGFAVEDDSSLRASAGVGIMWASPFGPLRVDYAVPIKSERYDRERRFQFGMSNTF